MRGSCLICIVNYAHLLEHAVQGFEFRVPFPDTPLVDHLSLHFEAHEAVLAGDLVLRKLLATFLRETGALHGREKAVLAVLRGCFETGGVPGAEKECVVRKKKQKSLRSIG